MILQKFTPNPEAIASGAVVTYTLRIEGEMFVKGFNAGKWGGFALQLDERLFDKYVAACVSVHAEIKPVADGEGNELLSYEITG